MSDLRCPATSPLVRSADADDESDRWADAGGWLTPTGRRSVPPEAGVS